MTESATEVMVALPWQRSVWQQQVQRFGAGRLPHALLLNGPRGCGKQHFAKALGQFVLCQNPASGIDGALQGCGQCKGCRLFQAGSHPDLIEIYPDEPGRPIKIDQIRRLTDFLGNAAQQGGYRVIILGPAESMNLNAANALLKGLEEPGSRTLFILLSSSAGQMLPTIRSRCQTLSFSLPDREQALAWLEAQAQIASPELLLDATAGAPLEALAYHRQGLLSLRSEVLGQLADLLTGKAKPVAVAADWAKQDPLMLIEWWQCWMKVLICQEMAPDGDGRVRDVAKLREVLPKAIEIKHLFTVADKLRDYRGMLISRSNPNPQLLFEDLLIQWVSLKQQVRN